jgi:hypothetical protein
LEDVVVEELVDRVVLVIVVGFGEVRLAQLDPGPEKEGWHDVGSQ